MQLVMSDALRSEGFHQITIATPFDEVDERFYAPLPVVRSGRREVLTVARSIVWALLMFVSRGALAKVLAPLATREIRAI